MTRIKYRHRPVWHETRTAYEGRPLLVAETPSNLLLRRKGTRQVLECPWGMCYLRAAMLRARLDKAEKINRRKESKRQKAGMA